VADIPKVGFNRVIQNDLTCFILSSKHCFSCIWDLGFGFHKHTCGEKLISTRPYYPTCQLYTLTMLDLNSFGLT